ncbi:MAG TPA: DUF2497 domain-containing protein [Stellaceae bacterium]|jgi:hypothetical protein|nr:DUF2497 domain-containing protein [Stellaceae bacterium]
MSDTNKDQHEPSMEEILASIRRIISEDGEPAEAEPAAAAPEAKAPGAPGPAAPKAPGAPSAPPPPQQQTAAPARTLIADVEPEEPEEDDSDVLVLTDEIKDETAAAAPPVEESPLSLEFDEDEPPPEPEPKPAREPEPLHMIETEPETEPDSDTLALADRLLSEPAAAASLAAMSELVNRSHREPNIESLPMGQANQTLEDLTRELLRPILKSWLDDNLPQIVERIVREEIGRLALDAQRR